MRPYSEAPPQDPSTDGDRPLLQPVFGQAEPDRHDDQNHIGDTVDGPTADPAQPDDQWYADEQAADQPTASDQRRDATAPHDEQPSDEQPRDAVADDVPHGERRMDELGDINPDDDTGTTHHDEPVASDEPARHDPALDEAVLDEPVLDEPADDEPAADPHAGEPTSLDEPTDLQPGDGPVTLVDAIWAEDSAQDLRNRWREAQLRFVDDPRKAASDTRNLVNEAVDALTATLASHREQLNSLPTNGDTEQYRLVVQRYRTFFERLLTL
jgi:hypothetical protein